MDDELREILNQIREDIKVLNYKVDKNAEKVDDLLLDFKVVERNIRRDIKQLKEDDETIIKVLKQHDILPR